ncbi:hypothetical protein ACTXT7_004774 [Hymenolepis weldensis]
MRTNSAIFRSEGGGKWKGIKSGVEGNILLQYLLDGQCTFRNSGFKIRPLDRSKYLSTISGAYWPFFNQEESILPPQFIFLPMIEKENDFA